MDGLAADLADRERILGEALHALEAVALGAQVVVDRHRSRSLADALPNPL
jgi:hypothetical protein